MFPNGIKLFFLPNSVSGGSGKESSTSHVRAPSEERQINGRSTRLPGGVSGLPMVPRWVQPLHSAITSLLCAKPAAQFMRLVVGESVRGNAAAEAPGLSLVFGNDDLDARVHAFAGGVRGREHAVTEVGQPACLASYPRRMRARPFGPRLVRDREVKVKVLRRTDLLCPMQDGDSAVERPGVPAVGISLRRIAGAGVVDPVSPGLGLVT